MTATQPTDVLPDYNGEKVHSCTIKFTGAGTGFTGLDVKPIAMELHDEAFFVMRVINKESPSHSEDAKGKLVRHHRVTVESMAPIDKDTADRVLQEYAQQVEDAKASMVGQQRLDDQPHTGASRTDYDD